MQRFRTFLAISSALLLTSCSTVPTPASQVWAEIEYAAIPVVEPLDLPSLNGKMTVQGESLVFDAAGAQALNRYIISAEANQKLLEQNVLTTHATNAERSSLYDAGRRTENSLNYIHQKYTQAESDRSHSELMRIVERAGMTLLFLIGL